MTENSSSPDRPGAINARPVRHPGRWVAVAAIAVIIAMMISSAVTNPAWDWPFVFSVMKYNPILDGMLKGTIIVTILAMIVGVVLGVLLAIMRLSENPILRGVSFVFIWFFRAIPRYVLLTILGLGVLTLYKTLDVGVPFGQPLGLTFFSIDVKTLSSGIWVGVIGLGLSEAAYMAEIARAGILSVDQGQREAAQALGMSSSKAMRRIILPQAMRVIVPPTGNEAISMVKDTSLLIAVPVNAELFNQASNVANNTYKVMPSYIGAAMWYLILCSLLMVLQSWLERRFGRGFGLAGASTSNGWRSRLASMGSDH